MVQPVVMTAARQVLISQGDSATNFITNWLHDEGANFKVDSCTADQEIRCLLYNSKVHHQELPVLFQSKPL